LLKKQFLFILVLTILSSVSLSAKEENFVPNFATAVLNFGMYIPDFETYIPNFETETCCKNNAFFLKYQIIIRIYLLIRN